MRLIFQNVYNLFKHPITKYWHSEIAYANQYAAYSDWYVFYLFTQKHRQEMSRLTNRYVIEICTVCNSANKAYM